MQNKETASIMKPGGTFNGIHVLIFLPFGAFYTMDMRQPSAGMPDDKHKKEYL